MKVVIDDYRLERMDAYTEPLEAKIKRQAAEITRLLAENEELKNSMEIIRDNAFEAGMIKGQQEAWELAQKIALFEADGGYSDDELKEIFNSPFLSEILDLTYTEAAAKVAEWERKKEEICVGDVVKIHEGNENDICVICISSDKKYYNAIDKYGALYPMLTRETISKTGRHIDVEAWLAQIGGESDE